MKKAGCLLTALLMALTILCGPSVISAARAEEEYTLPREEGTRQVTFYWYGDDNEDYDTCDMWIWFPDADGHGYLFHPCEYGIPCCRSNDRKQCGDHSFSPFCRISMRTGVPSRPNTARIWFSRYR